tara:strand:+ start:690 stop:1700 length:1011 start_codon:yes stop_codon:yes gene_type:complete
VDNKIDFYRKYLILTMAAITQKELQIIDFCQFLANKFSLDENDLQDAAREHGCLKTRHKKERAEVPYNHWMKDENLSMGWRQICVENGWTEKVSDSLPMSTQRITKEYSKEEWDAMSHEERDEAAIEHGKKAAHVTERAEAWKRFQDSEHFDSLCAQVAEINEKKGKTPAKQTSLPPVRSHEDMALEIERLEQKKIDKAQKKQKAQKTQETQKTQKMPEVPLKPPRRLDPVGPAFDKVDKNGDGVIDRDEFEGYEHKRWCLDQFKNKTTTNKTNNAKYHWMLTHPEDFGVGKTHTSTPEGDTWKEIKKIINFTNITYDETTVEETPWKDTLMNDSK